MAKRKTKRCIRLKPHTHIILIILMSLFGIYMLYLCRSFIMPAVTAGIFAFVSYPLYSRFTNLFKNKKVSAIITIVLLTFLILIPLINVFLLIAQQAFNFFNTYSFENIVGMANEAIEFVNTTFHLEISGDIVYETIGEFSSNIQSSVVGSSLWLINSVSSIIFDAIFVMIFMFYFYLYGDKLFKSARLLVPFSDKNKDLLEEEIKNDVRALFLGQGLVAMIQGSIAGLGLFIFGIQNVFLWSFVAIIFAFVPVVGTAAVWVPASIYLFVSGNTFGAIGLALWGVIITANIDNLIRPFLITSISKIDFLSVLVGVFVGISAFGLIGIILGPLLISVFIVVVKVYYEESFEPLNK